ncbi:hypothetical protein TSUD_09960 [Trifolium subterraneum]|nr:hypothetical protein TSUD_09960 [Trifolium subterraneum]
MIRKNIKGLETARGILTHHKTLEENKACVRSDDDFMLINHEMDSSIRIVKSDNPLFLVYGY